MRPGYDQNPLNPIPPVLWIMAAPIIVGEAAFALGRFGFLGGGAQGAGTVLRQLWVERTAFAPELLVSAWQRGDLFSPQIYRLLTYPFVHYSFSHALFVAVFLLALGNMVAQSFRPWAVVALFFASAIGAALIYTGLSLILPFRFDPLVGGYPAVYGMLGGFTWLLWTRLGAQHANRVRAFTLIGVLLLFQLIFGLAFGATGLTWIGDVAGFAVGFLASFALVPGGFARLRRGVRHR